MRFEEKIVNDAYIISIIGKMDTVDSKEVEAKLETAIDEKREKIIINLEGVQYISSVGLRVLLAALRKQENNHGKGSFYITSISSFVQNVFRITGLEKIFSIYPTEKEAVEALHQADEKEKL
jgi:anti-sigma B factor antagonist